MGAPKPVDPKLPVTGAYWALISPVVGHYMKKRFGKELALKARRNGKPIYRAYLDRAPRIGAACTARRTWRATTPSRASRASNRSGCETYSAGASAHIAGLMNLGVLVRRRVQ